MDRYSKIATKHKREIVLLKGAPCRWGRCSFCDYIADNSTDIVGNNLINSNVLDNVTGEFGILEVINSGNIFDLPRETLLRIKQIIISKNIHTLFFEAHWIYRKKLKGIREFFGIKCIVKTGLETFDNTFRERTLIKGFNYSNIAQLKSYFDSVCLMVGINGQTRQMIQNDINLAMANFDHFTVNVFINNSTQIKSDPLLIDWFTENYKWLDNEAKCDVLWLNTDFGVGE